MTILETERLMLRQFVEGDIDDFYRLLYADEEIKNAWSGATGSAAEIKAHIRTHNLYPEDDFGFRAIVLKGAGDLIGLMGYQRHLPDEDHDYLMSRDATERKVALNPDFIEVELTYALGRPYWKQGYASEMGLAMIPFGFERLGIGRIIQGVSPANPNSVNLMKRLGFRIEEGVDPDVVLGVLDDYESWRAVYAPE